MAKNTVPNMIYANSPAQPVKERKKIPRRMNAVRATSIVLLIVLCAGTSVLSQLDNGTTGKVYSTVSQMMHIDLKGLQVETVEISNGGHIAAGFVLCGVAQLLVRRLWVLPFAMIFFLGLEGGQLFSAERQADWMDVLRGWAGSVIAWGLVTIWVRLSRAKGQMCR